MARRLPENDIKKAVKVGYVRMTLPDFVVACNSLRVTIPFFMEGLYKGKTKKRLNIQYYGY